MHFTSSQSCASAFLNLKPNKWNMSSISFPCGEKIIFKKQPLSWGTTVVVNWNSLGHQRQAAVSGKGHKLWGLSLCRVAQHTSDNLQRAFTYLRRLENLKAETRQGGQRNAQCFTEHNGKTLAFENNMAFNSLSSPTCEPRYILYLLSCVDWPPD